MLTSIRGLLAATLLAGSSLAAVPALADETDPPSDVTITGSAAIVSQYRFRGLAQSDNKPAVQGALTLSHSSGFYISAWGSSASAGAGPINIGGTEIDITGGWTKGLGDSGVTVDIGAIGYIYPGAPLGNYYEIYGSLAKTFGPVTAKVGVNVAPGQEVFNYNWTSAKRSNVYTFGNLSAGIPGTPITLTGQLGYTSGGFAWGKDYLDYSIGASVKWKSLTLGIALVGTNVSKDDIRTGFASYINPLCPGTPAAAAACVATQTTYWHRMSKTTAVASLTASF